MDTYRKKPVVEVEAVRWLGNNEEEMDRFLTWPHYYGSKSNNFLVSLFVDTHEGAAEAMPGDWIIKEFSGEFWLCRPDIFDAAYEEVEG